MGKGLSSHRIGHKKLSRDSRGHPNSVSPYTRDKLLEQVKRLNLENERGKGKES